MHKHHAKILLWLIIVLAAGIRLHHLDYKSLSIDETIGTFYAQESIQRIFIMTINDVHPPLFYMVHHFWLIIFGSSEWAIRSISVFFALFSILILYTLSRRLFSTSTALLAALLLALSPWHIWISQNGRSNSMLLFLILLSTLFLFQLLQSPQRHWFLLYGIATLLSILTHYFAFMIWATQIVFVFWNAPSYRKPSSTWWQTNLTVILGYFIWLPFMISQFITKTRPMYKIFSLPFVEKLFNYLNPYAAVSSSYLYYSGVVGLLALFAFGLYHVKQHSLKFSVSVDQGLPSSAKYWLMSGFALTILINLLGGLYFNISHTLPILLKQLYQNSPNIFADTIKPYHLEQLHSLQICFVAAACIETIALAIAWGLGRFKTARPEQLSTKHRSISTLSFTILMLFLPLILAGILSMKSPFLLLRNMVVVLPFYIMILAFGLSQLPRWTKRFALAAVTMFALFSLFHYEKWYQKDDWRGAADLLKRNCRPDDVVLLDHLFGKKPLYYYGVKSHRPLRRSEMAKFLDQLKGDLWVLRSYKNDWCVVDSANKYLTLVGEWRFPGSTNPDDLFPIEGQIKVLHYHRPPKNFLAKKQDQTASPSVDELFISPDSALGSSLVHVNGMHHKKFGTKKPQI